MNYSAAKSKRITKPLKKYTKEYRLRFYETNLREFQAYFEKLIATRTSKLTETIEKLKKEAAERKGAESSLLQYAERMKALSKRLFHTQENERRHIALELHDEIGQSLTGIKLSIEMLVKSLPEETTKGMREAQDMAGKLLEKVRSMSLNLRPPMIDDFGILDTLLWHFEKYTAQTNVRVLFWHSGLERRFNPDAETAAYRVVQEALTNVARHALVNEVEVIITVKGKSLLINIVDNGAGFDLKSRATGRNTSGLSGMRERLRLIGGQLSINTAPGAGTKISAEIPAE